MPSHDSDGPRVAPRRHSGARIALFRAAELAAGALGGRALYRRTRLGPGRFRVREETVRVRGLPPEADGFTIVQLSDLHAGPFLRGGDLAAVVERCNALRPDLFVITGDFITHGWRDALLVLPDLARLAAPCGTHAVFGNHDYRGRAEARIAEAYAECGIRFLRNEALRLPSAAGRLVLVGLEDLEEARVVDLATARREVAPGDVEILLCHNPTSAGALVREGCAVILSGHTHGTQVDLPFLRGMGPRHPGLRVELGPTVLLVSRGLGAVGLPLRVGAPSELVRVCLRAVPTAGRGPIDS